MLFHPSSTGTAGPSHQSPLAPAEGLDRKPAIALTVINLGLLSSDAHGNSFTAGAGKSLSPAAFDAPSRQRSVRSVKAFANCCSQVNKGYFFRADFVQPLERVERRFRIIDGNRIVGSPISAPWRWRRTRRTSSPSSSPKS